MGKRLRSCPRAVRDVTFTNGFIRLIEIEELTILPVAPDDMPSNDPRNRVAAAASLELENTTATCTTESYARDGWAAVTWTRKAASDDRWSRGCEAYVNGSSISPALRHSHPGLALEDLVVVYPMWSAHGEDGFYLIGKEDLKNKNAWSISVNMRDNTLDGAASFSEGRDFFFVRAYQPFALSKYLDLTPDNCKVADGSQIQEREGSMNDPNNTLVGNTFSSWGFCKELPHLNFHRFVVTGPCGGVRSLGSCEPAEGHPWNVWRTLLCEVSFERGIRSSPICPKILC